MEEESEPTEGKQVEQRICSHSGEVWPEHMMVKVDGNWVAKKYVDELSTAFVQNQEIKGKRRTRLVTLAVIVIVGGSVFGFFQWKKGAPARAAAAQREAAIKDPLAAAAAAEAASLNQTEGAPGTAVTPPPPSSGGTIIITQSGSAPASGINTPPPAASGAPGAAPVAAAQSVEQAFAATGGGSLDDEINAELNRMNQAVGITKKLTKAFGAEDIGKAPGGVPGAAAAGSTASGSRTPGAVASAAVASGVLSSQAAARAQTIQLPQVVLANDVNLRGAGMFTGGSGFLIQRYDGTTVGVAQSGAFKGTDSQKILKRIQSFSKNLVKWEMFSKLNRDISIRFTNILGAPADYFDAANRFVGFVILTTEQTTGSTPGAPLKMSAKPPEKNDAIFLATSKSNKNPNQQGVHAGIINRVNSSRGTFSLKTKSNLGIKDFLGSPVMDSRGKLIGIVNGGSSLGTTVTLKAISSQVIMNTVSN